VVSSSNRGNECIKFILEEKVCQTKSLPKGRLEKLLKMTVTSQMTVICERLFSKKKGDGCAQSEDACQPARGSKEAECSKTCKEEKEKHKPGRKSFGHIHFKSPLG